ncbi:hypothetical protein ACE2LV_004400 [Salmonella enterica]|nr:hypothetical protein [Salmonella enterica]EJA5010120.1 hypothetical protein [Salmonella enterica]EJA5045957.1 hypothetical protein [Salmonella enterica]EJA5085585.1 hypothetical protein [Salmonella enterica]EJA5475441.1 hypothetical protein [Salmonella enterica]
MKKNILAVLLMTFSVSVFAQSLNEKVLSKSLSDWQPLAIKDKNNIITVTMNEDRVTPQIFLSVVENGVCDPTWFDYKKTSFLKKTEEIRILNRHDYQGLVLEQPLATCMEAGKSKDFNIIINSHTHSHTNY